MIDTLYNSLLIGISHFYMHDITRERHLLTLIKTSFLLVFFNSLAIYTNLWGKLSCNHSFIFDHPIICKISIDQSEYSSYCELDFDTERLISLIADCSIETMNREMIPYGMSLDIGVLSIFFLKDTQMSHFHQLNL
jgi:hypothetical protein